jgi:transposase InsO family protein
MNDNISIAPGMSWVHDSTECLLLKLVDLGGSPAAVVKRGDEYEQIPLRDLIREVVAAAWVHDPGLRETADDDWRIATLSPESRRELRRRLRAVNEVNTGSPDGYNDPDVEPRPSYDPARTNLTARIESMATELGVQPRTIMRWRRDYKQRGVVGLIHGNQRLSNALGTFDDEEIRIASELVMEEMTRSTKSLVNLTAILASRFRADGLTPLSAYRSKLLLDELSRGQSLRGTAKTRKSKASRPQGGHGYVRPTAANEQWDVDSIRIDALAYSPLEPKGVPIYGIVIIDHCTRVTSVHVTLSAPSATSVAIALYKRINPLFLPESSLPDELLMGIPKWLRFPDGILVHAGGRPGEIHTDLGREYENDMIFSLLGRLGCDVVLARPRTGADKATVEAFNKYLAHAFQLFPGYKGNTTDHRGDHPEHDRLLTLAQFQAVVDGICAVHNSQPQSGLRHPVDPGTYLSPAQMHVASILSGADLRVPLQTNLVFQFLPTKMATVTGRGPTINNVVYTTPDIDLLRRLSAGDQHVPSRQLPFHYDPNDRSQVYWHEPGTARWHTLHAVGEDGEALPPLSDALFDALLGQAAQRLPTKSVKQHRASLIYDYIQRLASDPVGRRLYRAEWNRWQERLTDPALRSIPKVAKRSRSTASGVHLPEVFEFDLEAYLDEVPDPEED